MTDPRWPGVNNVTAPVWHFVIWLEFPQTFVLINWTVDWQRQGSFMNRRARWERLDDWHQYDIFQWLAPESQTHRSRCSHDKSWFFDSFKTNYSVNHCKSWRIITVADSSRLLAGLGQSGDNQMYYTIVNENDNHYMNGCNSITNGNDIDIISVVPFLSARRRLVDSLKPSSYDKIWVADNELLLW